LPLQAETGFQREHQSPVLCTVTRDKRVLLMPPQVRESNNKLTSPPSSINKGHNSTDKYEIRVQKARRQRDVKRY
jgi:hypothetical protein